MATRKRTAARAADSAAATAPASPVPALVLAALEDMKAVNVRVLDVRGLTDITDTMIVASGNSDRHVRSLAERVIESLKAAGHRPYGVEGARDGEWALVDLHDVIVHVMLPRVREFYGLESLWSRPEGETAEAVPAAPAKPRRSGAKPGGTKSGATRPRALKPGAGSRGVKSGASGSAGTRSGGTKPV